MRRLRFTLAVALVLILASCGAETSTSRITLPAARITSVTPVELVPGAELTVSGANFFAVSGANGMKIEVCGVVLNGSVIEPLTQNLLLPPGSFITAQVGHAVAATIPEHGFTEGPSRVLVTRPDGNSAVLADAVTCLAEIRQPEPVVAVLAASATTAVAPAIISFDASGSTGEGELQYAWDFGVEGATASGAEVSYGFELPGEYTVTLTVTDSTAATATVSEVVVINPPLQAVIQHGEVSSYAPVAVTFDATGSTGIAPLTFAWDFGDGTAVSADAETVHEFMTGGSYTVTLTVTDANGDTHTAQADLVIAAPTPVSAVITADVITGTAPLTVNLSGLDSTGEGDLHYAWDFGVEGATASGAEVSFEYVQAGTYTVVLTVTDETGSEALVAEQFTVNPPLHAVIQHGEISSYAPVTVTFDATGSTGITPLTFAWDFGDGTPVSQDAQTTHEFAVGGSYTVTLTVTDANGATDSAEAELSVRPPEPVNAVITSDLITGTAPLTVNFSGLDSSGEGDLHYAWDFGVEGATSAEAEESFTFLRGGTYTVTLTVTDETGTAHFAGQVIEVEAEPASLSFVIGPAGLNPDVTVSVTGADLSETVSLPDGTLDLPPGSYMVAPETFRLVETVDGHEVISVWDMSMSPMAITLAEGEVRTLALGFEPGAGQLNVVLNGLPAGDYPDAVALTARHVPLGLAADVGDLNQLLPGIYDLDFSNVRIQHDGWVAEYRPVQASAHAPVSSGVSTNVNVSYELQPSLGVDVRFRYSDADVPFTLSGTNGHFTQNDELIPPGEYALSLRPVDYVNQEGQNGVSPTYERWTPQNSEHTVRLSSNEVTVIEPAYNAIKPVIRLTVSAPEDAVNFRSDVVISGPNPFSTDGALSGYELEAAFGSYCVTVRSTYYFDVSGTDYPGRERCFDINRASGYGGGSNAYSVRVNYRHKRVTFPDHPDGTASAGTIRYAYKIDEWYITEALITVVEVDGLFAGELPVLGPRQYKFQGTGTFEAAAGTRVRIGVTMLSQGVRYGPYWSPYLEIGP